ncbi:unnamed protein product, partial [Polarella glacialis]
VQTLTEVFKPFVSYMKEHEPTTLAFEMMHSDKDPLQVLVFERYADKDEAYLKIHRASEAFLAFRSTLASLDPVIDGHSYWEGGSGFFERAVL